MQNLIAKFMLSFNFVSIFLDNMQKSILSLAFFVEKTLKDTLMSNSKSICEHYKHFNKTGILQQFCKKCFYLKALFVYFVVSSNFLIL